jgi:hypothetical protein
MYIINIFVIFNKQVDSRDACLLIQHKRIKHRELNDNIFDVGMFNKCIRENNYSICW